MYTPKTSRGTFKFFQRRLSDTQRSVDVRTIRQNRSPKPEEFVSLKIGMLITGHRRSQIAYSNKHSLIKPFYPELVLSGCKKECTWIWTMSSSAHLGTQTNCVDKRSTIEVTTPGLQIYAIRFLDSKKQGDLFGTYWVSMKIKAWLTWAP